MMHEGELKDKCALCGKLTLESSDNGRGGYDDDFASSSNRAVEETIQDTHYRFDTQECAHDV
jgi:hypothetical protein